MRALEAVCGAQNRSPLSPFAFQIGRGNIDDGPQNQILPEHKLNQALH